MRSKTGLLLTKKVHTFLSPDYHVSHFISRSELFIIDSDHGNNSRYVLNEFLIGRVQVPEVFNGYGRLALSLSHVNTFLALLRGDVKMYNQVRLLPTYMYTIACCVHIIVTKK